VSVFRRASLTRTCVSCYTRFKMRWGNGLLVVIEDEAGAGV
jgi:hypothetical protein